MEYYGILGFGREPFSNSPDPDFFYQSEGHMDCLHRVEIAIRLRRGLNIVLGEVGLGKTTLCRQLLRNLDVEDAETHLILDPSFDSSRELLRWLCTEFTGEAPGPEAGSWEMKEAIKSALFTKAVDKGALVVLIVDEGQKISADCLEILRELLNYETNSAKLLQIVLFAQPEFTTLLYAMDNVRDRVNEHITLRPLTLAETTRMVEHRIALAAETYDTPVLFSRGAYTALYEATSGHPRKVVALCHKVILALIMKKGTKADAALVRACAKSLPTPARRGMPRWAQVVLIVAGFATLAALTPQVRTGVSRLVAQYAAPLAGQHLDANTTVRASALPPSVAVSANATAPKGAEDWTTPCSAAAHNATTAPQTEVPAPFEPPRYLGSVPVPHRESLSIMMARIYGAYAEADLPPVLTANSQLTDPDIIEPGQYLRFPRIASYPAESLPPVFWVELARKATLRDAYAALHEDCTACRILAYFSPRTGLTFSVIRRAVYTTKDAAQMALSALPQNQRASAQILGGNTPGMIYFGGTGFTRIFAARSGA
ncbi:AAA family ATPase [Desulfobaculum sp. SPO524]|uniref:AAA family ATPase n=1 Tax=Desulfobaculum sp. SPO524 TaxID=3378071 RepID=UPI0038527E26